MPPQSPPEPEKKTPLSQQPQWRTLLPYVFVGFLLLWIWQDIFLAMTIQTIPYSQFKTHLARGEVTKCSIREDQIDGQIVPKPVAVPKVAPAKSAERSPATTVPPAPATSEPAAATSSGSVRANPVESAAAKTPEPPATTTKPGVEKTPGKTKSAAEAPAAKPSTEPFSFHTIRVEDPKLVEELEAQGVDFRGERPSLFTSILLNWVLPLAFVFLLWTFLSRRLGTAGQAFMSIGKSRARMLADRETGVTFADVAGCDEAKYELQEIVDFLRNPKRYEALGARIPKGVLLVGPPGTGKTLLARAVAGEAKVPFFSLSGSEFVEMFVGVGASRVRDLFEQAKKQAPCIIFIDELDAIGRQRGVHIGAVNDEREQTLNQLLVEMDGFEANVGVILLAATNRPDVLDRAILRPGRFDRQVLIDSPDIDGRVAILKVHARNKPLAPDVDLRRIAQATPGFSGADLSNAINEAALLAARRLAKTITQHDLEEAVEKVVAGPERKSRRLEEEERRRVAVHEVGHALVAVYSPHADPVHKISIVPRGRAALGYTLQLPEDQQFLLTRTELVERIRGLLGGRGAEEVIYHEVSTGAENDLERATALARQMVCTFGMSKRIGLVHCGFRPDNYLQIMPGGMQRDFSEHTAEEVDREVKQLLDEAYAEAKRILTDHRDQLELIAGVLFQRETLDRAALKQLLENGAITDGHPAGSTAETDKK